MVPFHPIPSGFSVEGGLSTSSSPSLVSAVSVVERLSDELTHMSLKAEAINVDKPVSRPPVPRSKRSSKTHSTSSSESTYNLRKPSSKHF